MDETRSGQGVDHGHDKTLCSSNFKQACETVWTEHIICDLIYGRGLHVCQLCLGFFNGNDKSANHPSDYCIKVSQLCIERQIVNAETFFKAMWFDAIKLVSTYGKMNFPRMDAKHVEHQGALQRVTDSGNLWLQTRVHLLEKHAQQLEVDKTQLLAEKRTLQMHFHRLLERSLNDKIMLERIKLTAEGHLDALHGLLHPMAEEETEEASGDPVFLPK